MAAALKREDIAAWAAEQDIKLIRPEASRAGSGHPSSLHLDFASYEAYLCLN